MADGGWQRAEGRWRRADGGWRKELRSALQSQRRGTAAVDVCDEVGEVGSRQLTAAVDVASLQRRGSAVVEVVDEIEHVFVVGLAVVVHVADQMFVRADAAERSGVREVVETAVGGDEEIDGIRDRGREVVRRVARIEPVNPSGAEIGEEIGVDVRAAELPDLRRVT